MIAKLKQDYRNIVFVLLCTIGWGIFAHGMALFNKYSFHDDTSAFNGVGVTFSSGRWMLDIMSNFTLKLFGNRHYSLPLTNGMITILCVALILYLAFDILHLQGRLIRCLICGIVVSFPAITCVFGFMFTAPYYYAGLLMGVIGAYLYNYYRNLLAIVICMTLMACSYGTYQAHIPVCVCILLLILIQYVFSKDGKWLTFFQEAGRILFILIGSFVEYYLINEYMLRIHDTSLSDFRGINTWGRTDLHGYLQRIGKAYKEFFNPTPNTRVFIYYFHSKQCHIALIAVFILLSLFLIARVFRENRAKALQLSLLASVFPLAAYLIFVMVPEEDTHSLMTFAQAFTFLFAAWIYENTAFSGKRLRSGLRKLSVILLAVMLFMLVRISNLCYLKSEILQSQAISYFTTLASRIQSLDEYTDDTPVVYINEYMKYDKTHASTYHWFDSLQLNPYSLNTILNDYDWRNFMALWCGYRPVVVPPTEEFLQLEAVKAMPCYPDQGSIQYIYGFAVVKFAD